MVLEQASTLILLACLLLGTTVNLQARSPMAKRKGGSRKVHFSAPEYHATPSGMHALSTFSGKKLGMKALGEEHKKVAERQERALQGTHLCLHVVL